MNPTPRELSRVATTMMCVAALRVAAAPDAGAELPPTVWAYQARLAVAPLADGGYDWRDSQCFPDFDGGTTCAGGWLPEPRLESEGAELVALRTENPRLKATTPLFSTLGWAGIAVAAAIGLALGLVGGFEFDRLLGGK